jgi:hypothetical protein
MAFERAFLWKKCQQNSLSENLSSTTMLAKWHLRETSVDKNVNKIASRRAFHKKKCQQNGFWESLPLKNCQDYGFSEILSFTKMSTEWHLREPSIKKKCQKNCFSEILPFKKMSADWPLREHAVEKNVNSMASQRAFRPENLQHSLRTFCWQQGQQNGL